MAHRLQHEVRRASEAGKAEALRFVDAGELEGAVAHRAGAKQRRGALVRKHLGNGVGIVLRNGHVLGIATVDITTGGAKLAAQILGRRARRGMDPTYPHPIAELELRRARPARVDAAHHLVTNNDGQHGWRSATLDHVELGMADTAGRDPDAYLAGPRLWYRELGRHQRLRLLGERGDPAQQHRLHRFPLLVRQDFISA